MATNDSSHEVNFVRCLSIWAFTKDFLQVPQTLQLFIIGDLRCLISSTPVEMAMLNADAVVYAVAASNYAEFFMQVFPGTDLLKLG